MGHVVEGLCDLWALLGVRVVFAALKAVETRGCLAAVCFNRGDAVQGRRGSEGLGRSHPHFS